MFVAARSRPDLDRLDGTIGAEAGSMEDGEKDESRSRGKGGRDGGRGGMIA